MIPEGLKRGARLIPGVAQFEAVAKRFASRKAAAGLGATAAFASFAFQGLVHPFGTEMDINQQEGTITGFYNLYQTDYAGAEISTGTDTVIHAQAFGHDVPGAYLGKSVTAEVDVDMHQKNGMVRYSYNKATGWTTVRVPKKALGFSLSAPPEDLVDGQVHNGPTLIGPDVVAQVFELFTDKGPGGMRGTEADGFYKIDMYSNYDAAYRCIPLAWKTFGAKRFEEGNARTILGIGQQLLKGFGVTMDASKIKVIVPKEIPVPANKYSDAIRRIDGESNVDLQRTHGQCEISKAAIKQAKALTN